jgi:hypothetical protein
MHGTGQTSRAHLPGLQRGLGVLLAYVLLVNPLASLPAASAPLATPALAHAKPPLVPAAQWRRALPAPGPAPAGNPAPRAAVPPVLITSPPPPAAPAPAPAPAPGAGRLAFEPNVGQIPHTPGSSDPPVQYLTHSSGGTLFFAPDQVVLAVAGPQSSTPPAHPSDAARLAPPTPPAPRRGPPTVARLHFLGANAAPALTPGARLPGIVNYFLGNDPRRWHTNIPTYSAITYQGLYPGIDLAYGGTNGTLKGTYLVAAGADPSRIHWRYDGATSVQVDPAGNLQVHIPAPASLPGAPAGVPRTLTEQAPLAW